MMLSLDRFFKGD